FLSFKTGSDHLHRWKFIGHDEHVTESGSRCGADQKKKCQPFHQSRASAAVWSRQGKTGDQLVHFLTYTIPTNCSPAETANCPFSAGRQRCPTPARSRVT